MASILVYSEESDLAYKLLSAVHEIGDKPIAVAINNEELAINLARRGAKVLAIKGDNLSTANTATIAWVLKHAVDKTHSSGVLLSNSLHLNRIAEYLSNIMGSICLIDIDHLSTKHERLVCKRNSPSGICMTSIEVAKKGVVIAMSSKAFPPAPECNGGSIIDIRINPLMAIKPARSDENPMTA